jgi:hypothetical protein
VIDRWSTHIEARTKLSPLVGAWYTELGGLNKWCHIWAYKDAADRAIKDFLEELPTAG